MPWEGRATSEKKMIRIELDRDTYERLLEKATDKGYLRVEEYIMELIKRDLVGELEPDITQIMDKLKPRIKRYVEDIVNEYLSMVMENKRRIAELYEKIEEIKELVRKAEEKPPQPQQPLPRRRKKTGIEILREQKVLFESRLERLRDKDRFFDYLKRQGAIVLELEGERIAVDPDFWMEFKEKISGIQTHDEREAVKGLSPVEQELFMKLRRSQVIIYDSRTHSWRIVEEPRL